MPVRPRPAEPPAQRDLLETLVAIDSADECLRACLEWLRRHAQARDAWCGGLDPLRKEGFVRVRGHGLLPSGAVAMPSIDPQAQPLGAALRGRTPVRIEAGALGLGSPACSAIGLWSAHARSGVRAGRCVGLLLAGPAEPELERKLHWLARRAGPVLGRLLRLETLEQAERRLAADRAQLERIIRAVPDPILLRDGRGRRLLANAAAQELLSAGEDANEGRRRAVALNNALLESATPAKAGPGRPRELFLLSPRDGSELLYEQISARSMAGGVLSVLRNVTALRRATTELELNFRRLQRLEAESRSERDRLDLVLDSVSDPIVVTDPAGQLVMMNRPAELLFTIEDARRQTPSEQAVRENGRHFTRFVTSLLHSERDTRLRGNLSLTDPQTLAPIPVHAHAGKLLSDDGALAGMVTILHDRTEALEKAQLYADLQKASAELEQKVRDATAELLRRNELLQRQHLALEQASAAKTQFLANMSHEFRTPLNAILGYTAMMLQGVGGELPSAVRRSLSRVDSNARHLVTIVNDILDISRIESGRMPLTLSEFDLQGLVAELTSEVEPLIQKSKLDVRAEVPGGLAVMRGDRQKLKQVLLNLITNALKFTAQGSVSVRVAHEVDEDQVAISVEDTGIGIAPADHERIFEDFRQADNSNTRQYGGTGLGLAIVRRLVAMMDGRVTLTSALGEGSTFTVTLPRRRRKR